MKKRLKIFLMTAMLLPAVIFGADFSHIGAPTVSKKEAAAIAQAAALQASDFPGALSALKTAAEKDWPGAAIYFNLANLYWRADDFKNCEIFYRKALEKSPSFFQSRKNLGLCLLKLGKAKQAYEELASASALCGGADAQILIIMSLRHRDDGDFSTALVCANQALMFDPDNSDALRAKLSYLVLCKNWGECVPFAESLLRKNPKNADAWKALARAQCSLGNDSAAIAALEGAALNKVSDSSCEKLLGDLYLKNSMTENAESVYGKIRDRAERESKMLLCAKSYFNLADFKNAERVCDSLKNSRDSEVCLLKAACIKKTSSLECAEKYLSGARLKKPNDARIAFELARICADMGDYVRARSLFNESKTDAALKEASLYGLLRISVSAGDLVGAVKIAGQLDKNYPCDEVSEYLEYLKSLNKNVEKPAR